MTAPLTPQGDSRQTPHDDPWHKHSADAAPPSGVAGGDDEGGTAVRSEVRQAAVVAVAVAVTGVLLGLLWVWLAPRVPLISDGTAVFLKDTEGEEAIGADGTFALLALAFGAVSAAVVFLFRRRGGIPLVVGLALGGLLGAVLAWQFGGWFGPDADVVRAAKDAGKGVTFDAPLELNAKGALLAWPIAAMVVHLALTALFGPRDPEPEWEWGAIHGGPQGTPGTGLQGDDQR
ncbi:DUF2567 domain-containing protein [Streptomyces sp. NPDC051569]|uniref:DUF2567 domain-containing protein n=1 Tax=Streptomyces sp. NPDC051569 TaxID=3365661 RepID=UPI00379E166D